MTTEIQTKPTQTRRALPTTDQVLLTAAVCVSVGVLVWLVLGRQAPAGPSPDAVRFDPATAATPAAPPVGPQRQAVSPMPTPAGREVGLPDGLHEAEPVEFAALLRELVAQSLAWRRAMERGAATGADARQPGVEAGVAEDGIAEAGVAEAAATAGFAEELWERLRGFDDAGSLALAHWVPAAPSSAVENPEAREIHRRLCAKLIEERLAWLWERGAPARGACDAFVHGVLTALQIDAESVALLSPLLLGAPYLGSAHEDVVQGMIDRAAERPELASVSLELLLTLWRNLEARGERLPGEIVALALLFEQDANPVRRLAALRELLVAHEGRFRSMVVQRVVAAGDEELAREIASAAASDLPTDEAMEVLRQVRTVGENVIDGSLMVLAHREPGVLATAYDHELAANRDPELRKSLVSGAGFLGGAAGVEVARTAFHHDPDPSVRTRAMYALTAHAGAALGEQTLMAALDDRGQAGQAFWLSGVAGALDNLARSTGDPNAVQRVAQRLLARPELSAQTREQVEAILARVLPRAR